MTWSRPPYGPAGTRTPEPTCERPSKPASLRLSSRMNLLVAAAEAVAGVGDRLVYFRAALSADDVETWSFDTARVRLLHGEELHRRGSIAEARAELFVARQTFAISRRALVHARRR